MPVTQTHKPGDPHIRSEGRGTRGVRARAESRAPRPVPVSTQQIEDALPSVLDEMFRDGELPIDSTRRVGV